MDLLDEYGDEAKILAGGQSLVPMLAMRLTHFENLVDISRVDELVGIDRLGDEVRVTAATRTCSSKWTTRSPRECRCLPGPHR
ncbi:FAD binding domain in molybdopterin dehydrogenase family protein [Mycobacterium xenopi 4042]|uniref:FAD binding domain in molybdopterin dehydrogenase family protein n=1 Tax=Mycobacterium xenopi 4042 TaxID=1299334 RepID=X8DJI2_MYCXE|nr:FAD binding domain in molybdopterin dehydrogenase family protein [Mycobacterium xenopi 4042]